MQTFEAIESRRSIKHFDPQHEFSDQEIKKLMGATLLSPTSFNIQNWRFVVVRNKEKRQQIFEASYYQAQVKDASLLVVLCADLKAHEKQPERYWRNAPQEVQNKLIPMITGFYGNNDSLQRDEAMRSTGIAAQTLMLAAKDMGYDSCPMVGFDSKKVAEIISLPEDHVISMFIVVGKATQPARERGGQLDYSDVIFEDQIT